MSDDELNELIRSCALGKSKAQEQIYRLLYGKMKVVCLRYTKDAEQAQDILQDGFIKVFASIGKYQFEGSFEGWVRRIMVNTAIDYFRKKRTDFILIGEDNIIEAFAERAADVEEEGNESQDYTPEDIVAAMQKLTPAYRTIFNLYVYEQLTHQEIADRLGISPGTSKSNFAKAKRNLKKILTTDSKLRNE